MTDVKLYGSRFSVYTRIAILALKEKGVAHTLVPVNPFALADGDGDAAEHRARHPFGKIPVLDHGDLQLYETAAITQYVEEAFDGPALQPGDPAGRARMRQTIGICDAYGFAALVQQTYVPWQRDPAVIEESDWPQAMTAAQAVLDALADRLAGGPYLAGDALSLADLHLMPMLAYARCVPALAQAVDARPALAAWWAQMADRDSVRTTRFRAERRG